MFIHDKRITVITIQAVTRGKPHETALILMYFQDGKLRQTFFHF